MTTTSPDALLAQLNWRYATKKFDAARKIDAGLWAQIERALVLTPSSFGLQPWRFIVVTDASVKQALVPHSWGQTQPAECSHHVIFTAKNSVGEVDVDHFVDSIVTVRGGERGGLAGYRQVMVDFVGRAATEGWLKEWATRQAYIALGNFMTSCAVLGVDTCPMEGIVPAKYDEVLGLASEGYSTVVACAAGYRASDDRYADLAKVRHPVTEMVRHI